MSYRAAKREKLGRRFKKYCRWLRLYTKRVRIVEREIGGELAPC